MEELLSSEDFEGLAAFCEQEELQSEGGIVNPHVYINLLAVYLLQNELDHAKLLWQRMPEEVKELHPVLAQLWDIGKQLWRKNFPVVYELARSGTWPDFVAPMISSLIVRLQDRVLRLVGKAYSSIHVTDLCALLGQTEEEVKQVAAERAWSFDVSSDTYQPFLLPPEGVTLEVKEERLQKLTDIISFLEN